MIEYTCVFSYIGYLQDTLSKPILNEIISDFAVKLQTTMQTSHVLETVVRTSLTSFDPLNEK